MMKICIFIDSQGMGGIESHIIELVQGLMEHTKHEIDLMFWHSYNTAHPITIQLNLLYSNDSRLHYIDAHRSIKEFIRYCAIHKPIIHTHGYKAGIIARIVGAFTRTAIVSTFHNGDPGKGKLRLYNLLDRLTSFLSLNIAVNELISAPLHQCQVISNFVSTLDKATIKQQENSRKQIAFVGRLNHEKGPDIFADITKNLPYPITMYGDGPMMSELKSTYSHIDFKGMCNMEEHWRNIRLLVMPSRYEGLPLAALEAMARGIPVIASNAGSIPKLLKECGIGKCIELHKLNQFELEIESTMQQTKEVYIKRGEKLIDYIDKNYSRRKNIPKILDQYNIAAKLMME
jgi:glycosyltransferase involved in cell wall biosynthesis